MTRRIAKRGAVLLATLAATAGISALLTTPAQATPLVPATATSSDLLGSVGTVVSSTLGGATDAAGRHLYKIVTDTGAALTVYGQDLQKGDLVHLVTFTLDGVLHATAYHATTLLSDTLAAVGFDAGALLGGLR